MHRSLLIAVSLAGIFAGCSRIAREPTRKIEVPDSGFPVLTTEERAAQEKAGQTDAAAESPRLVSQASYLRPMTPPSGTEPIAPSPQLKPFEQWTEQDAAKDALGRIGSAAVPPLVDAIRHPDPTVRLKAVEVLGRMGEEAQSAVPDLVNLLNDPDEAVRKAAARTLGRIGPAAQAAVPALVQKLFEPPTSPQQ